MEKRKISLKWKLIRTYLTVVFIILLIFEVSFMWGIREYYYGNIEQILTHRINTAIELYDNRLGDKSLQSRAKFLIESQTIPNFVTAQILDTEGNILDSTSQFSEESIIQSPDYLNSKNGNIGTWIGNNTKTDEKIMAVSAPLYNNNYICGAIRFITSIEKVNSLLIRFYVYMILIGISLLVIALMISVILASNIIKPIIHLKSVANKFARGDLEVKAISFSNDELGDLADAFNYMAKEIKSADKIKNEFVSSISHEIRTPLTSIMAWSQTLLEGGSEEEQKEGLEIISKESIRLTGLVETLLDFSKMEAKTLIPDMEIFDMKNLIESTVKQFQQVVKKKKIDIIINSDLKVLNFYGDKYRLKQVLINIIDNAIKHSYVGNKINIYVDISKKPVFVDNIKEEQENYLLIQIDDEGEGISEHQIEKLSTLFYKGNEKKQGSGIGLAVSKKIVDMHEGKLIFKPIKSGGTSVLIWLPRRKK